MQDFDELLHQRLAQPIEERQFKLRGELFTVRASIRPEVMGLFVRIGDQPDDERGADAVRDFIEASLIEDDIEKWDKLRDRTGDDALTIADMTTVAAFVLERVVGRPPTKPSASGETSQAPTTTASKDESSSPVGASAG